MRRARARAGAAVVAAALWACTSPAALDGGPHAHVPDAHAHDPDAHAHDGGHPHDGAAHDGAAHDAGAHPDDAGAHPDDAGHLGDDSGEPEDAGVYTGPARLSETGLYRDLAARALADGVLTYRVHYELWADGAEKLRYLALPPGTTIDASDLDRWRFPVGTRSWKEFRVGGVPVETRLLEKTAAGWRMAAYVWADDGSEAWATPAGQADARGTAHDVPSSEDCRKCHRGAADVLIGVSAIQLGPDGIAALTAAGVLGPLPPGTYAPPGPPAVRDALGYLHGNCGHCHNDHHPLARLETLRLHLTVSATRAEDTPVYRTAFGARTRHEIDGTRVAIDPGFPTRSQLVARMRTRDPDDQMPPLGTEQPDPDALRLIEAWVSGL